MSVRTLNYTNRKRIRKEDARIWIQDEKDYISFDAELKLDSYQLPADALVFVEAYRQAEYMRFDFGTVGDPKPPPDRRLSNFDSADGILFRVKVVKAADPPGLLLAQADQIRPKKSADEEDNRMPLLTVVPDEDMDEEIWKIDFGDDGPVLKINSRLGDWRGLAREPVFGSLVYPSILRAVLWHVLYREKHRDTEDIENWCSRWLRFACDLPGVGALPRGTEAEEEEDLDSWIDEAVSAFCRHHMFCSEYERYSWKGQ